MSEIRKVRFFVEIDREVKTIYYLENMDLTPRNCQSNGPTRYNDIDFDTEEEARNYIKENDIRYVTVRSAYTLVKKIKPQIEEIESIDKIPYIVL